MICSVIELALIRFSRQRSQARGVRLGLLRGGLRVANGAGCSWLSCRGLIAIEGGVRENE
jgi:hypothetical protein